MLLPIFTAESELNEVDLCCSEPQLGLILLFHGYKNNITATHKLCLCLDSFDSFLDPVIVFLVHVPVTDLSVTPFILRELLSSVPCCKLNYLNHTTISTMKLENALGLNFF